MNAPYKTLLCIDFETRWSSTDYTLSKMTTEAYIRDPRFKAFGVCIHEVGADASTQWYRHDELAKIFSMYDWTKTAVLAQNSQFDAAILSMIYGVQPCFIFDSLSMARALRGVEVGNSLMKLAEDYGLPPKGHAVHSTNGLEELTPEIEHELAEYCKHDVYLCEQIFLKLMRREDPDGSIHGPYPSKELRLIDMTVRMYTNPMLTLDVPMLEQALQEENAKLAAALARAGVEESALASNPKFADILRSMHITPPMKVSKTTKKPAYALAKNDALFQALLNGDNADVASLCEARLRVKSTLERTRAQRFIEIADRGALPVPLSYYGASVTGRWAASKGSNINLQNMKRGSFLRKSIMAPAGNVLCVGDLSQIEPRVLAWLADYEDMLDIFRAGGDPYAAFGAPMFNVPGMTKESHPVLRQSAKSALLGAGYQLGWASFAAQLLVGFLGAPPQRYGKAEAKQLGVTSADIAKFLGNKEHMRKMREIPHFCAETELLIHCLASKAIIDKYRVAASPVVDFWGLLGNLMEHSLFGGHEYTHKGILHFSKGRIELPSGMHIRYDDLRQEYDEDKKLQYTYTDGRSRVKLYPGKICNNVTQGTARVVMSDGMLRVQQRYPVVGTVHDELLALVPDADAETALPWVLGQMTKEPKWMPGIPLDADGGTNRRYGLAKN